MPETTIAVTEELIGEETDAELAEWMAEDGSAVSPDQPIAELATAKAIVEVPAPVAGVLKHLATPGDVLALGQAFASVATEA